MSRVNNPSSLKSLSFCTLYNNGIKIPIYLKGRIIPLFFEAWYEKFCSHLRCHEPTLHNHITHSFDNYLYFPDSNSPFLLVPLTNDRYNQSEWIAELRRQSRNYARVRRRLFDTAEEIQYIGNQ